jgi:hypothetical protein
MLFPPANKCSQLDPFGLSVHHGLSFSTAHCHFQLKHGKHRPWAHPPTTTKWHGSKIVMFQLSNVFSAHESIWQEFIRTIWPVQW